MSELFHIVIPARLGSTRLPEKPLRVIAGRPMIVHTVERARDAGASSVTVATDSDRIAEALTGQGIDVLLTDAVLASGTDRVAAVVERRGWADDVVVVNLQGDEPLAPPRAIRMVARALTADRDAEIATLSVAIESVEAFFDPAVVKVVVDAAHRALYFSRAPIPWPRDGFASDRTRFPIGFVPERHIGLYAYRAGFLARFRSLPGSRLEAVEVLEQLRVLEAGGRIAVARFDGAFPGGVDTEADLARVEAALAGVAN